MPLSQGGSEQLVQPVYTIHRLEHPVCSFCAPIIKAFGNIAGVGKPAGSKKSAEQQTLRITGVHALESDPSQPAKGKVSGTVLVDQVVIFV